MSNKSKYLIGSFIILIGLGLVFHKQIALLFYDDSIPTSITAESIKKEKAKATVITNDGVKSLNSYDVIRNEMKKRPISYVGLISIPSIGFKQPIINELSDYSLSMGAAITTQNNQFGMGNMVLAGHFSYLSPYMLFSPLYYNVDQGASGQNIYVTDLEYVYTFKTIFYSVVENADTKYIQEDYGDNLITLYTCNYYNETGKVVIQGELESKKAIQLYDSSEIKEIFFK